MFERIPVPALLLEASGEVIALNPAAERMFEKLATLVVGRPVGELLLDNDLARILDSSRLRSEQVHELQFETSQGRRTAEFVISAIEAEGRAVFQLFAIDITARKAAEAAARTRADAEEKSSAKERLESLGLIAGGVAHDFNNLLVGVLAESSAAREEPGIGEGTRDALRRIEAAAQRMAHLTRQMLAYAGRGRFVMQRLDPDEMLGESAEALTRMIRPAVQLSISRGAGRVVVDADPGLLRQVVSNLVSNASDANSSKITLSTRVLLHNSEPFWQLEVADDGAGMSPAILAKIFEPFFSTSPERHGLGLSAVHGIVRRLGGDIEVDSTPGRGARFTVRLPIVAGAQAPRPRQDSGAPPAAKLAGLRVLIADDEPSVRATVRRLLERRGATVVLAADGIEAEARLRDQAFGLVILDVVMPGRSGYDVLAIARHLLPRCPIILMSGYSDRSRGEGGDEEPDAFLEKPFTAAVLDAAIDDVMLKRPP
ncbi:MAG: response regulator [Myxococcales bacterium]|nr:response regulator [Myxococcales bacterium]